MSSGVIYTAAQAPPDPPTRRAPAPKPHSTRLNVPATARIANPTRPMDNARLAVPKERNRASEPPLAHNGGSDAHGVRTNLSC